MIWGCIPRSWRSSVVKPAAWRCGPAFPPDLLSDGQDDSRGPEFSKAADRGALGRLVAQETADRTAFDELVGDAAEHPFAQARMAVGAVNDQIRAAGLGELDNLGRRIGTPKSDRLAFGSDSMTAEKGDDIGDRATRL